MTKERRGLSIVSRVMFSAALAMLIGFFVTSRPDEIHSLIAVNLLFSLLFALTFIYILKRNTIFGVFYALLYIYTIFTQIAYILYPDILAAYNRQYFELDLYYEYILFVALSFFAIFVCFIVFGNRDETEYLFSVVKGRGSPLESSFLFGLIIALHNAVMLYFLVSYYQSLSYYGQAILKGNKFFFFGFYFYEITIMALYVKVKRFCRSAFEKIYYRIALLGSLGIFLSIAIRSGQRFQVAVLFLGISVYYLKSSTAPSKYEIKRTLKLIPLVISALLFMNMVGSLRGSEISLSQFVHIFLYSPVEYLSSLLNPQTIIFQDYTGVSLVLATSMRLGLIFPQEVIKSNLINATFLDYPSLGGILSRIIDPSGWQGYGYYFLAEGYNLMGWYGILYNGLISVIGFSFWKKFVSCEDPVLRNYMLGIIAMHVLEIVRGQSSFFIKGAYYAFVPAIALFCLAGGLRVRLNLVHQAPGSPTMSRGVEQHEIDT